MNKIGSLLYETHQLLTKQNQTEVLPLIKEEIILYNPESKLITSYCVVMEQAEHTIQDLINIWKDKALADDKNEFYSQEKFSYYVA